MKHFGLETIGPHCATAAMPPFLSNIRSRTNSLLDTITGVIPEAPPNATYKDRSLTCRKCGNRFRDALELSSHFNLLPHHSDYSDSYDWDAFVRPKVRRSKPVERAPDTSDTVPSSEDVVSPAARSFSEAQAYYAARDNDQDKNTRPTLLRKIPTFSNLSFNATGDGQQAPPPTDYADNEASLSRPTAKAKGKQKASPRFRRDESYLFAEPLASSDEDYQASTSGSSFRPRTAEMRLLDHRASAGNLLGQPVFKPRPRSATSSAASRSSATSWTKATARQPRSEPPQIPLFDWQEKHLKSCASLQDGDGDAASIRSEASFRTAESNEDLSEKARIGAYYAQRYLSEPNGKSCTTSTPSSASGCRSTKDFYQDQEEVAKQQGPQCRARHASESNLLLESIGNSYFDAPPTYQELHGDADPFEDLAVRSERPSKQFGTRLNGFATMPASPVSCVEPSTSRRPRRSTNAWPFTSGTTFPATPTPFEDNKNIKRTWTEPYITDELSSTSKTLTHVRRAGHQSRMRSKTTDASLPPLVPSSPFSSTPSPSTPKTPLAFFADDALASPTLSLPPPKQPNKSSAGARQRSRQSSRAKSDAAVPSTRCPTCFVKFASLGKTLEHLESSDCGTVEFESGIL